MPANAQIVFDGNILFDNAGNGDYATDAAGPGPCFFTERALAETVFTHNQSATLGEAANPLLTDPYNESSPNWVPQVGSAAVPSGSNLIPVMQVPNDGWFTQKCFRGAVPPASLGSDWTQGWTYFSKDGAGRTDIDYGKPLVILTGSYGTLSLSNANNYLLRGRVGIDTLLTIPAGTVIFGEFNTTGYLVIERGADIDAQGTAVAPIIFTSDQAPGSMGRGDWGGVVIHGRAIANCADCASGASCASEGGAGDFCGNDDDDNSGTLRYVRVEYGGIPISVDNELNNLTMNAVGRNTTIEFVQTHMGDDDNFEWFGGTARCRNLVSTGAADDNFDWQMGFRGSIQCAASLTFSDIATADKAIEADNNEFNNNAPNRSNPTVSNMTACGRGPNAGVGTTIGVHLRRGTGGTIINSIIMGFKSSGIDVDDAATFAAGCGVAPAIALDCDAFTGVPGASGAPIGESLVVSAFPNPAVDNASISFSLPTGGRTRVDIFDAAGRRVVNLLDRTLPAGAHEVSWSLPANRAAGNYFYRVASGGTTATGKIVSIR